MKKMTIKNRSININKVKPVIEPTLKIGVDKFDKWFSKDGGVVIGSAIYVTGSSGAGKTTLMINLMKWLGSVKTSMYLKEMSKESTREQTSNIVFNHDNAFVSDEENCPTFDDYMEELEILKPKVIIIDSLQAIAQMDYADISEDSACNKIVARLRKYITKNNAILFLIGHVTKDDTFAGRNTIMQYMDAHMELIFHKKEKYRTISWGQKNRKGPMGTLYYTFGKEGIEFYTEGEWSIKNSEGRNLSSEVLKTIQDYLDTIDKKNIKHSEFKSEYNKRSNEIHKNYSDNELAYTMKLIELTQELTTKYSL